MRAVPLGPEICEELLPTHPPIRCEGKQSKHGNAVALDSGTAEQNPVLANDCRAAQQPENEHRYRLFAELTGR